MPKKIEIQIRDRNNQNLFEEAYKPLYVLIREMGIEGASCKISEMMKSERHSAMIRLTHEVDGNTEMMMPDFELVFKVVGDSQERKESIRQTVLSTFKVIEYEEADDEMRFTSYRGEGPRVYDIRDVITVANGKYGQEIDKRMASVDLTDYKVIFTVCDCW
ncbi:hypothetical protein MKZ07_23185 [Paenibacillus sp. FSL P4-0338]|uniref:hypothetical protein n=1 Tax=Paenibacillus sp. FSL P4-0338 TaxID=2921635 RepID=UPI0030FC6E58